MANSLVSDIRLSHLTHFNIGLNTGIYTQKLYLMAMEPGDTPVRMNYTVRKDGSLSGDLADREQLKLLERYIFRFLGSMVEDIASGNVEPNPYTRGSSHSACSFCPYGSICHEKTVEGRRNYKAIKAKEFWEAIRKEMTGNGR